MMISNHQVQNILKQYASQQVGSKAPNKNDKKVNKKESKFDEMLVSEQAKLHQSARKQIKQNSEVREEKISSLQEAIRTGNYNVSNDEIAEKMLARSIVDELI